jgi:hypothetical protein
MAMMDVNDACSRFMLRERFVVGKGVGDRSEGGFTSRTGSAETVDSGRQQIAQLVRPVMSSPIISVLVSRQYTVYNGKGSRTRLLGVGS